MICYYNRNEYSLDNNIFYQCGRNIHILLGTTINIVDTQA